MSTPTDDAPLCVRLQFEQNPAAKTLTVRVAAATGCESSLFVVRGVPGAAPRYERLATPTDLETLKLGAHPAPGQLARTAAIVLAAPTPEHALAAAGELQAGAQRLCNALDRRRRAAVLRWERAITPTVP